MTETNNAAAPVSGDEIFMKSQGKAEEWRRGGVDPYGKRVDGVTLIEQVRAAAPAPENLETAPAVRIAGRVTAFRGMGKSIFADIKDYTGRLQVYAQKDKLGDKFDGFKRIDIGDIVSVEGHLFITKMGELTLKIETFDFLSKSLRTLPEKWHGLTDIETRYRRRYVDLIVNDAAREVFRKRFMAVREIRRFLEEKGFLEVETPMLQPLAGGAAAKPFKTFHEALGVEMYLRIAPELYLKRLLVAGFDKVFELNRNFRNEGLSKRHNPEFTMLEIYQAYGDCRTMMALIEELITRIARNVFGTLKIARPDGQIIDLTSPWKAIPYRDLVKGVAGADWFELSSEQRRGKAAALGLHVDPNAPDFEVTNEVYEKLVEPTLVQPTFVTQLPYELVPLAKRRDDDPALVDVFELEINGQEIAPGYSELNDPMEQRRRFEEQLKRKDGGETAVCEGKIDEDFLRAMEYGMPPAGGMGIGIDRLLIMLTGAESIRDVILFPHMRPE